MYDGSRPVQTRAEGVQDEPFVAGKIVMGAGAEREGLDGAEGGGGCEGSVIEGEGVGQRMGGGRRAGESSERSVVGRREEGGECGVLD